jgi:hypothetical protein
MKPLVTINNMILIILIWSLLNSCNTYDFSMPQPIDKTNINAFPREFLGSWIDEDSTITILVNKSDVSRIQMIDSKVVDGAWPKLDEKEII